MSYHNGSIWPHDNALIAYGASRYGLRDLACDAVGAASEPDRTSTCTGCPSCSADSTASRARGRCSTRSPARRKPGRPASVFLLLQACLGLDLSGPERHSASPAELPLFVRELRIHNLEVAGDRRPHLVPPRRRRRRERAQAGRRSSVGGGEMRRETPVRRVAE